MSVTRTINIGVKVSPTEHRKISAAARKAGYVHASTGRVNMSDWIRATLAADYNKK